MRHCATIGEVVAPCSAVCPLHDKIPSWIGLFGAGKHKEAWELLTKANPFPAILGRACYRFCETKCNHLAMVDGVAVKIGAIERCLGDLAIQEAWQFYYPPATRKPVLVIGAGPAGLIATLILLQAGIPVTLVDRETEVGGMMRFAIPAYRLPAKVVSVETARILAAPHLTLCLGVAADAVWFAEAKPHFAAVIMAPGATLAKKLDLPNDKSIPMVTALSYLRWVAQKQPLVGKKRVIVYGGGNTAMDAARTALRLGASEVTIIYHRIMERMSAAREEIEAAREEGISIICERTITALTDYQVQLVDQKGRTENLPADLLIFALSQKVDASGLWSELKLQDSGMLAVDDRQMTNFDGIFAAGDAISSIRNLPMALKSGQTAAQSVIAYLDQKEQRIVMPQIQQLAVPRNPPLKSRPQCETKSTIAERVGSFTEVNLGFDPLAAEKEAKRCYHCGNCIACRKCYTACPVGAIISSDFSGQATSVDFERCIGCGRCVRSCPSGAIAWHNSDDSV